MDEPKTLSPDQVVSRNLMRARELRGWTQQEAAERISRCLGREWTVPVLSAAERSHRTSRVKEFSATEITAFCRVFKLPLAWFYLPPDPWTNIRPRGADEDAAFSADELLSVIFPRTDDPMIADLEAVTIGLFSAFANQGPRKDNTATYVDWVRRQNNALRLMFLAALQEQGLGNVSGELADISRRIGQAVGTVVNDLMHDGIPPAADE